MKPAKDSLNLSWVDTKALNIAITRWDLASEHRVSKGLPLFIGIQMNWKTNQKKKQMKRTKDSFESVYQNVNKLENKLEKGADETPPKTV